LAAGDVDRMKVRRAQRIWFAGRPMFNICEYDE